MIYLGLILAFTARRIVHVDGAEVKIIANGNFRCGSDCQAKLTQVGHQKLKTELSRRKRRVVHASRQSPNALCLKETHRYICYTRFIFYRRYNIGDILSESLFHLNYSVWI